jgi:LPXTG-site transpeptidase (sortase) family protein
MPNAKPQLSFDRPILEPSQFHPTRVWTEKEYIYRYDVKRAICKRSPIDPNALTGTMFFTVSLQATTVPLPRRRRKPRTVYRLTLAGLWVVLIAAALLFIYPLWPAAVYRWQQLHPASGINLATATLPVEAKTTTGSSPTSSAAADQIPVTDNRVIIPAIGVDTPIVEGPNLSVLNKTEGVWHQTGSVNHGNFVLAGHRFRYLPPNTSTLYNLNKLDVGDLIAIDWLGKRTVYQVTQMEVVPQSDVAILNPTVQPRLTLYSCNDIRQTQRVVAIATPLPTP